MSSTCPCCGWDELDQKPYERWPDRLPVDATPPYEDSFATRPTEDVNAANSSSATTTACS